MSGEESCNAVAYSDTVGLTQVRLKGVQNPVLCCAMSEHDLYMLGLEVAVTYECVRNALCILFSVRENL